jgi:hypothetical protein
VINTTCKLPSLLVLPRVPHALTPDACTCPALQFAVYTGIVGLAMYAFASGVPVLIIALFGSTIQKMHPDVVSISDFAGKRFGPVFRTMVSL